uniref:Rab-GAP TBC domain-containing protein n=1 Tax=Glossina brevipalpis TaxID=37001 RepID=A0A1A9WMJ3_9MUSC
MTARGIEAIKLNMQTKSKKLSANINLETECNRIEILNDKETITTMTPIERYRLEWQELLKILDEQPERIREYGFEGHLKTSKFRSIYWSLMLRVLNEDYRNWKSQRSQQRQRYKRLKRDFVKNPHELADLNTNDNPLSQSSQSIWNQYFSNQELFAIIGQDVVRTFPGVDFFRKSPIQSAMCNILFYYAREHPYMSYRQGMHEILAPVIFVMYGDHQSLLHFKEITDTEVIDTTLANVLDPDYLEADCYFIFSRVMASVESYYRVNNVLPSEWNFKTNGLMTNNNVVETNDESTELGVIAQLNSIRDKILAKEDLHLHNYLLKLDIPLHIFGIRWLRLLFGREFTLLDLLALWDAIFADSDRFDLPNYIVVAMLIRIRDKCKYQMDILLSDYTTCLTYLMRYPSNVDVSLILRHALHMQMPKKYDRPTNAFVYFTMPSIRHNVAMNKMSAGLSQQSKKGDRSPHGTQGTKPMSCCDTMLDIEKEVKLLQVRNAADAALLARLKPTTNEESHVIMEGYARNNPDLERLELKNAQTVITVARNKLQNYLHTIRRHITIPNSIEVMNALDGIEELCQYLDVKFMFPLHSCSAAPIDQALEANEQQQQQQQQREEKRKTNKPLLLLQDDDCGVVKLSSEKVNQITGASAQTIYEKPDNGFMLHSSRILGNLKEIELLTIARSEHMRDSVNETNNGLPTMDPLTLKD